MKIILDAMSGDNAPAEIVKGAVKAVGQYNTDIILVGDTEKITECLIQCGGDNLPQITIAHASDVIDMHDDPSTATRRKKDSSMTVALNLLKNGEGDACISAGNTGALLTGATLIVKRIHGIRRAALAPVLPNGYHGAVLIDCGANVECTPEYLLQFAYMGSFYAQKMLAIPRPRVGLLNNGSEDTKGTELCKEVYKQLSRADSEGRICFVGNIEACDIFSNKVDVIVTDGFTGNILLKSIEGTAKFLMKNLKGIFYGGVKGKLSALLIKNDLGGLKKLLSSSEVGGTPLLGISKPVLKAHGNSDSDAICNAVRQAISFTGSGMSEQIQNNMEYMRLRAEPGEANE